MMKANEIRLGNYFKHNSEWCYRGADTSIFQWSESDWYALGECTLFLENIEPIPLTEDWANLFGYECLLELVAYMNDEHSFGFCVEIDDLKDMHVHQLQNLIFALTGKELKRVEE